MVHVLGWLATLMVLAGFYFNSIRKINIAFLVWILGDILWIYYDYLISNWSHAVLSIIIIGLNIYGIYKIKGNEK